MLWLTLMVTHTQKEQRSSEDCLFTLGSPQIDPACTHH